MVKLKKKNNLASHSRPLTNEDINDPCRHSEKLLRLANDPNPMDLDEFFDAIDEDYEEFVKRVWGGIIMMINEAKIRITDALLIFPPHTLLVRSKPV